MSLRRPLGSTTVPTGAAGRQHLRIIKQNARALNKALQVRRWQWRAMVCSCCALVFCAAWLGTGIDWLRPPAAALSAGAAICTMWSIQS